MISVEEAKRTIRQYCQMMPIVSLSLAEAAGRGLAEDVFSPVDLPPFNQSSMDGYAVRFSDLQAAKALQVSGTVHAGRQTPLELGESEAIRIFTGAAVPAGADTVIMQEETERVDDRIYIRAAIAEKGLNVRRKGAEIRQGDLALKRGTHLGPPTLAYLAGMGVTQVSVYAAPRVGLLVTGDELVKPGETASHGQVYESASFALKAAMANLPVELLPVVHVKDDYAKITEAIRFQLEQCDVLITTGGVSVGDFDFTVNGFTEAGVERLFHRVKQKPGKPLYFGRAGNKLVFGLPGNPSSVLTCFYQYVAPALAQMTGSRGPLRKITGIFSGSYQKNPGLTHFLKARLDDVTATHSGAQESYKLSSFALADCLVEVPENTIALEDGQAVTIYLIP